MSGTRDDIPHEPRRLSAQRSDGPSQLRPLGPRNQHHQDRRTIRRGLPRWPVRFLPRGNPVRPSTRQANAMTTGSQGRPGTNRPAPRGRIRRLRPTPPQPHRRHRMRDHLRRRTPIARPRTRRRERHTDPEPQTSDVRVPAYQRPPASLGQRTDAPLLPALKPGATNKPRSTGPMMRHTIAASGTVRLVPTSSPLSGIVTYRAPSTADQPPRR